MLELRTLGGLSVTCDGAPGTGAAAQRKTLALLALLAAAGDKGISRDKLIAFLWSESDADHGRNLLNQACYALRRDLHAHELFLGATELRLNPTVVLNDIQSFEDAIARGDSARAVAAYAGPFLDGFYLDSAPDFERWVESERARLAKQCREALEGLATEANARGDHRAAVGWWRRLATVDPLSSRAALGLMRALDDAGERAQAVEHGRQYEAFVRRELEVEPAAEVLALAKRFHHRTGEGRRGSHEPSAGDRSSGAPSEGARRTRPVRIAVAVTAILALGGIAAAIGLRGRDRVPILAVGAIRDYAGTDTAHVGPTLAEMLATNLARVPRLQVLSTGRIYGLLGPPRGRGRESTTMQEAARAAHATQLLEGVLYRRPAGALRLELQRVDLQSGVVLQVYAVEGPDAFALADSVTTAVAAAFGFAADTLRIADVTTRSLAAYRMYVAGLRALYRDEDPQGAVRLFEAALAEDSTFAMAAYYAGTINPILSGPTSHLAQAVRLADHVSDRERLLIRGAWARETGDPADLAIAETLAIRYPTEPDGHYLLGTARMWRGDFLGGVVALRVVTAMDSLGFRGVTARCRGCEAMGNIVGAYEMADSLSAAERTAREFLALQPHSRGAWFGLAVTLEHSGRFEMALAAYDSVARLSSSASDDIRYHVSVDIRRGDFAEANALVGPKQRHPPSAVRWEALWWGSTILRHQGRLRDALALARAMRAMGGGSETSLAGLRYDSDLIRAQVLFEMGHAREAASLFDSLAAFFGDSRLPSRYARHLCWMLTHRATALAAAGDTAQLPHLADSLEILGLQSSYGRDRQLFHHLRGLLLIARNRPAEAEREFRQAVWSLTYGYTRTNFELARALMTLGRPREAIAVLQPAFRGPLDASNLYVTHTELHEMLARAFDAAGERDSAVTHYRWVVAAWRNADPEFRPRFDQDARRLIQLSGR
jgi:DNA-binding SARP family transcriptional activator